MTPTVSTVVIKALEHANEVVRKINIICMHRFYQIAPEVKSFLCRIAAYFKTDSVTVVSDAYVANLAASHQNSLDLTHATV